MVGRALVARAMVMSGLVATCYAAAPPPPKVKLPPPKVKLPPPKVTPPPKVKLPPPKVTPPPPKVKLPPPKVKLPPPKGPGAVQCSKCNATGYRWDNHQWKPCGKCNGAGWLYPGPGRPPWRWHGHDGWGCFVATAAYGTPWDGNVATLRSFRDECLMTSPVGQGFVSLYYAVSPPLADAIRARPWARAATRVVLTPAVTVAGALTGNPADMAIVAAVVGLGILGGRRWKRRRAKL